MADPTQEAPRGPLAEPFPEPSAGRPTRGPAPSGGPGARPYHGPNRGPYCGQGATPYALAGCQGTPVGGHPACLAHLDEADRAAYLAALTPGADLDHRGTPFTQTLLDRLLAAVHDDAERRPRTGAASFAGAVFAGDVDFRGTAFTGAADFDDATFTGRADLHGTWFGAAAHFTDARFGGAADLAGAAFHGEAHLGARFGGDARFDGACFRGTAEFGTASFGGNAWFGGAEFRGEAWFTEAEFTGNARFGGAAFAGAADFADTVFGGDAHFGGAQFGARVRFDRARFGAARRLGPLVCGGTVRLDGAEFGAPVTVEIAAAGVSFRRTRWEAPAALRLRRATVDLAGAVLEHPVTLVTYPRPFTGPLGDDMGEEPLADRDAQVHVRSLDGVDAARLTLTDADLTGCPLTGVVHLADLRLEDTAELRALTG
ncbi:pentapeptide repeat-containing protein [Streptomyces phytohabitans]|uniref:pentapeptide repeat-containing protein n=1 Tax=Streptomyces phytohabitans TaxID=1150371 RepID=UPI00345BBECA